MDIGAVALETLLSPILWIVVIGVMTIASFGALYIRKQKKLEYTCFVIRNNGLGKIDVRTMKAGWFKKHSILFGLLDWRGEESLYTGGFRKPVDRVLAGSTIDFHDIDGKKGLICRRKDDDPKILVPLTKMEIQNDNILAKIANADLRDAATEIVKQAEKETRNRTAEIVQWILMGGVIMLVLVVIIMSYQFVSRGQAETWEYVERASRIVSGAEAPITNAP